MLGSLTEAQRTQTKAAVAIAQQTVDSLTVKAPIDGTLSLRSGSGGSGPSGLTSPACCRNSAAGRWVRSCRTWPGLPEPPTPGRDVEAGGPAAALPLRRDTVRLSGP